ncbi:MAG TPA: hypothetical protein VK137_20080 [Planctomycetaceae bacterium]|nr:hypothetical protein [Planctomycetaceae bacterium]
MTVVEEITTRVAALPEQGQREVLDFVEFLRQRQRPSSLRERGRALARRARERNVGVPQDVLDREIEQGIEEVRQQGRA